MFVWRFKERRWRVAKYVVPYSELMLYISPIQEHSEHTHNTLTSCQTWGSNLQPSGCKSESLSIRPQLYIYREMVFFVALMTSYFLL